MSGYDDAAISSFDFHHSMLADSARTQSFLKAILSTVEPGDVVVDIGAGTGVLSMFAVMAGARMVYAIEREPIIGVAMEVAEANGLSDRIRFIHGSSDEVDLPEEADIVISETIGNIGFDEGIAAVASDAARRFAKPGARYIPERVDVHAALVEVPRDFEMIGRWNEPMLTLDFSALQKLAVNNVMWADISPVALVTEPQQLLGLTLGKTPELEGGATFVARRRGTVHGLGVWFSAKLNDEVIITNAPPNAVPSWEQGLLPNGAPMTLGEGDTMIAGLESTIDGSRWAWSIGEQNMSTDRGKLPQAISG